MTVIPTVVGAFETVRKGLENILKESEIREKIEVIQNIAKSARILRWVLETQIPVKGHELKLVWELAKSEWNIWVSLSIIGYDDDTVKLYLNKM